MKKYKLQVFSHEVNVDADYEDFDRAYEMYFKAMYSGGYSSGHLMDLQTGEVYMNFQHSVQNGNWSINQYISSEVIPAVIKQELYNR